MCVYADMLPWTQRTCAPFLQISTFSFSKAFENKDNSDKIELGFFLKNIEGTNLNLYALLSINCICIVINALYALHVSC